MLPLLLLETMRDRDRPDELLEDEDFSLSLPRRLGLSEVVRRQIDRFEQAVRRRYRQSPSQVEDLVRLVNRRPDAGEIFVEAGRRVAQHFWDERSAGIRRAIRVYPRPLALIASARAGRRMFADLVGTSPFRLSRRPITLQIDDTLTARADPDGAACGFYTGAFAEVLELYTHRTYHVVHASCAASHDGGPCRWTAEAAT